MLITTKGFLLTIICDEATAEHLVPNMLNFDALAYTSQKLTAGSKSIPIPLPYGSDAVKLDLYFTRSKLGEAYSYVDANYAGKYPVFIVVNDIGLPY